MHISKLSVNVDAVVIDAGMFVVVFTLLQLKLAGKSEEHSQTTVTGQEMPHTDVIRKPPLELPVCANSRYETRLSSSPTRKRRLTAGKQDYSHPPVCNDSLARTSTTCEPLASSEHGSTLPNRRRSSRSLKVNQSEEPTVDGQNSAAFPKCDGATHVSPVRQSPQIKSGKSPQHQSIRGAVSQSVRFSPRKMSVSPVKNAVVRRQRMKSVGANADQQPASVIGSLSSPQSNDCFPNVGGLQSEAVADSTSSQKITPKRRSSRRKMSSSEACVTSDPSVSMQVMKSVEAAGEPLHMSLGDEEPLISLSEEQQQLDVPANKVVLAQSEELTVDSQNSSTSAKCYGATHVSPVRQSPQIKSGKSPQSQYILGAESGSMRFSPRKMSVSPVKGAVVRRHRIKSVGASADLQHVIVNGSLSSPKSDDCFPNVSDLQSLAVADSTSSLKVTPKRRSSRRKMSSSEADVTADPSLSMQVMKSVEAAGEPLHKSPGDEKPFSSLSEEQQQQDVPANKVVLTQSEELTVDTQNSLTSPKCDGAIHVSPVRQSPQIKSGKSPQSPSIRGAESQLARYSPRRMSVSPVKNAVVRRHRIKSVGANTDQQLVSVDGSLSSQKSVESFPNVGDLQSPAVADSVSSQKMTPKRRSSRWKMSSSEADVTADPSLSMQVMKSVEAAGEPLHMSLGDEEPLISLSEEQQQQDVPANKDVFTQSEELTVGGQNSSVSPKLLPGAIHVSPTRQSLQIISGNKSPQSQSIRGAESESVRFSPRKMSVSPIKNAVIRRQRIKSVGANADQQHVSVDGSLSSQKSAESYPNVDDLQSPSVADSVSSQKMTSKRRSSRWKMSSSEADVNSDASLSMQVKSSVEASGEPLHMSLGDAEPFSILSEEQQQQDVPANKVVFTTKPLAKRTWIRNRRKSLYGYQQRKEQQQSKRHVRSLEPGVHQRSPQVGRSRRKSDISGMQDKVLSEAAQSQPAAEDSGRRQRRQRKQSSDKCQPVAGDKEDKNNFDLLASGEELAVKSDADVSSVTGLDDSNTTTTFSDDVSRAHFFPLYVCIFVGSGTDPILLLILFYFCCWGGSKPEATLFRIGSG